MTFEVWLVVVIELQELARARGVVHRALLIALGLQEEVKAHDGCTWRWGRQRLTGSLKQVFLHVRASGCNVTEQQHGYVPRLCTRACHAARAQAKGHHCCAQQCLRAGAVLTWWWWPGWHVWRALCGAHPEMSRAVECALYAPKNSFNSFQVRVWRLLTSAPAKRANEL
jgi:hypothetical protein